MISTPEHSAESDGWYAYHSAHLPRRRLNDERENHRNYCQEALRNTQLEPLAEQAVEDVSTH